MTLQRLLSDPNPAVLCRKLPLRANRAACRLRSNRAVSRRVEFRIGINVGDVIVQGGGLFGDGVNVAMRLEGLADPGGICISRTARDQVRDRIAIALHDIGEVEVKNIARPVRVFRAVAGKRRSPR